MISVKIHRSYRNVVAIADSDIIGKKFEEGNRQLDVRANFFSERELQFEEVVKLIESEAANDSTFNIVGEKSISAAIKSGLVNEEAVVRVQGVPFILVLI